MFNICSLTLVYHWYCLIINYYASINEINYLIFFPCIVRVQSTVLEHWMGTVFSAVSNCHRQPGYHVIGSLVIISSAAWSSSLAAWSSSSAAWSSSSAAWSSSLAAWSSSSAAWSSSSAAWSSCHRQPGSLSDNEWVFLDNRTKCMSLEGHQKLPCKHTFVLSMMQGTIRVAMATA